MPRSRSKPHWYFISVFECPICSRTTVYRERRYGRKPKDWHKLRENIFAACDSHFL